MFWLDLFLYIGLIELNNKPRIKILVKGKRINIPKESVINPGIKRKNPPIGVNKVFKKLSAVGSKVVLWVLISSKVLIP